jgi:hypothetical protein
MPKIHVLIDKHGEVLGTFQLREKGTGRGMPSAGLRAQPDQRLVELEVDEKLATLEAGELHKQIKERHLK